MSAENIDSHEVSVVSEVNIDVPEVNVDFSEVNFDNASTLSI